MAPGQTWKVQFKSELVRAEAARTSGNEGKARVCARRAAGLVVAEYLQRQGLNLATASAIEHLKYLADQVEMSPVIREVAVHFMLRVSDEHDLPVEADLIEEARWLAAQLLPEE